jgi:hypothetical protein
MAAPCRRFCPLPDPFHLRTFRLQMDTAPGRTTLQYLERPVLAASLDVAVAFRRQLVFLLCALSTLSGSTAG